MKKNKKLFKVVIQDSESFTAYIFAASKKEAKIKAIMSDVDTRSNQDFEQKIINLSSVPEDEYPIGITINE
jgi:hypothetical protein